MDINGKIIQILPEQNGQGKNGVWRKQEFIIETSVAQYPKKICFSLWGEKIDQIKLKEGEAVTVFFDAESREFNGRWYTELRSWKITKSGSETESPNYDTQQYVPDTSAPVEDDLPF